MTLKIEQEASRSINLSSLKEQRRSKELDMKKYSFLREARSSMKNW